MRLSEGLPRRLHVPTLRPGLAAREGAPWGEQGVAAGHSSQLELCPSWGRAHDACLPRRMYVHTLRSPRLAEAYCDRLYDKSLLEGKLQGGGSQLQRQGSQMQRSTSRVPELPLPRTASQQLPRQGSSGPAAPQAR